MKTQALKFRLAFLLASWLLCLGNTFAQSADNEPAAVLEIGGAAERSLTHHESSFGPTVAAEFTAIENWLELEGGVTPVFGHHATEWSTDLLFKKPWTLSRRVEFMLGAGPEWIHTSTRGIKTNAIGVELAPDFMFWPGKKHRFGWYLEPSYDYSQYLASGRLALSLWVLNIPQSIQTTLIFFFLLFILRVVLRKEWLAGVVFVAIWTAVNSLGRDHALFFRVTYVLLFTILVVMVFPAGFIALAAAIFCTNLLGGVPLTTDFSAWYFGNTLFPLLSVVALAIWGFYHALAGQKLWSGDVFN